MLVTKRPENETFTVSTNTPWAIPFLDKKATERVDQKAPARIPGLLQRKSTLSAGQGLGVVKITSQIPVELDFRIRSQPNQEIN